MSNKKALTILLKVGMMKKIWLYKMSYLHTHNKSKIEVELDLSNCATKSHLKKAQVLIHRNLLKGLIMLSYYHTIIDHILASYPERVTQQGIVDVGLSDHQLIF